MTTITILGQVPSQKNGKNVGVNPRTGRVFVTSNAIVKAWQEEAAWQLKSATAFPGKVAISYVFYVKDNRRRDLDNMVTSVNDSLVKAGIIADDSWQVLEIEGACGVYDKENPRVMIFINEV